MAEQENTGNQGVIAKVVEMISPTQAAKEPPPKSRFKRVQLIINPAAGQDKPILKTLNSVFNEMEIEWDVSITKEAGDGQRLAQEAVAAGVDAVASYGGDGTVLEIASGLKGSNVPLAILPGGTANVLSIELGIPRDLIGAAMLLADPTSVVQPIDMGAVGEQMFFHLGIGLEGKMVQTADREAKDQAGIFAYITAALRELTNPLMARYQITLDGEEIDVEGINCMITNFGSMGIGGLTLSHAIDISDGLMDVIVFRDANVGSIVSAAASAITAGDISNVEPLLQWQAREVRIAVDPPQKTTIDGEVVTLEHIHAKVLPGAVQIIVPPKPDTTA